MHPIYIDFNQKGNISEQIAGQISALIRSGALQPGNQLPTVRELADQLQVNFNTVARSYRALDQEKLISTQQGRGTYVLATRQEDQKQPPSSASVFMSRLNELVAFEANRTGQHAREIWKQVQVISSDELKVKNKHVHIKSVQSLKLSRQPHPYTARPKRKQHRATSRTPKHHLMKKSHKRI